MKIETSDIRNGKHDGDIVWICHYNQPDLNKKPLRNIKPTRCIVCSNEELPKNKTIYYSNSHFKPISKHGAKLSQVISPVDNTGYRCHIGNELFVFDNKDECEEEYRKQVMEVVALIDKRIESAVSDLQNKKSELISMVNDL